MEVNAGTGGYLVCLMKIFASRNRMGPNSTLQRMTAEN